MKQVSVSCPHCRRVYTITVDLEKLARLRTRAKCARCSKSFDVFSRLQASESRAVAEVVAPHAIRHPDAVDEELEPKRPKVARVTPSTVVTEVPEESKGRRKKGVVEGRRPRRPIKDDRVEDSPPVSAIADEPVAAPPAATAPSAPHTPAPPHAPAAPEAEMSYAAFESTEMAALTDAVVPAAVPAQLDAATQTAGDSGIEAALGDLEDAFAPEVSIEAGEPATPTESWNPEAQTEQQERAEEAVIAAELAAAARVKPVTEAAAPVAEAAPPVTEAVVPPRPRRQVPRHPTWLELADVALASLPLVMSDSARILERLLYSRWS